ncbi:MAG: methyltransferase domain-containing protein [Chitinivibrionales bacterium]|nr:methyltransferase domain-containing protein [Chitinivibrionales bacterium]
MSKIFNPEKMHRLDSKNRRQLIPPQKVLKMLDLKPGETLLDIGAGIGYFAIPALEFVGNTGKVIAADISSVMLDELKRRSGTRKNLETLRCSPDAIPLPDSSANTVLFAFVYHEIDDRVAYLKEIHRLLKDNGEVAIVEWDTVVSPGGPPLNDRLGMDRVISETQNAGLVLVKGERINEYQYLVLAKKKY